MKVTIYADGGSRGNPGIAGSGTAVFATDGTLLKEVVEYVGHATNNVAEYHGLINGLTVATELGADEVAVFMDSKLVVEQMSGRWKIKHKDMLVLAQQAHQLIAGFTRFSIQWVPREKNKHADRLSNVAMDAGAAGAPVGFVGDEPAPEPPDSVRAPASTSWTGATDTPLTIYLVRHGETEMSAAGLYAGRSDPPLTERGVAQADKVAEVFRTLNDTGSPIDAVIASPLRRAQSTARAIAEATRLAVHTEELLTELDFGQWDGLTFDQARQRDGDFHAEWLHNTKIPTPGGESVSDVDRRVHKALAKAQKTWMGPHGGKTIVWVSHVTPIKAAVRRSIGAPISAINRLYVELASISRIELHTDGTSLLRLFNSTAHLS